MSLHWYFSTTERRTLQHMAMTPRFDRGLSVVRVFSNLSFNIGWIRLLTWQIGVVIQQTIINSLTSTEHSQHLLRTPIGPTMGLSVTGCLVQLVWWVRFLCSPPGRQAQSHPNTPCSGEHSQTSRASATPRAASYTQHPPLYTLVWYWTQDLTRQGMTWCDN